MSVQPRPTDTITVDFLQLGMPYIEFAPALSGGAFGPFRSLGVVDSAEIAKTIELATLRSAQSGTSVKLRELVRSFDAILNVGLFQHSPENMQLMFGSSTLVDVTANPAASIVGDPFVLTDNNQDFLDLSEQLIDEATVVITADQNVLEPIGTGQGGTFGETTGDFRLDFKISVIGDVTLYQETTGTVVVDRTADLVAGAAPLAGQIGIEVGATAISGQITYPAGEAPASGVVIEATYEPTFATVLNTDFTVDPQPGRVRLLDFETTTPNTEPFRQFQTMEADYDFNQIDHDEITPFTQFTFSGQTRIRLLTDVGINMIWTIPVSSVRVTDDAFVFNRDEFQVTSLVIDILDAGGSVRFGVMEVYPETP
jgi:hypothetical protein